MVLHIAHIMPSASLGGVEFAALRLMSGLEGTRFHNTAFCLAGSNPAASMLAEAGFEVATYEPVEPSYRHPRAFLRNSWRLAGEFRRRGVGLVHCQDLLGAYYASVAARLVGVPVVCHVRSQRPYISRRDGSFLRAVNRFIFVSRNAQECFGSPLGRTRGQVIYDGFDFVPVDRTTARSAVEREFGFAPTTKIAGMFARIARQKDYETLVRAARQVVAVEPEARFLVVGDYDSQPDYRAHYDEVQAMVAEAGLSDYVVFTGHRTDVLQLLAAMDVSVLCTHTEGFALSVLEAMAQGVPVVVTAVGGLPEFVIEGETGLLHAHRDADELAAKILTVWRDPALAARMSERGSRLVATRFNCQQTLAETADLYTRLLAGGRGTVQRRADKISTVSEVIKGGD